MTGGNGTPSPQRHLVLVPGPPGSGKSTLAAARAARVRTLLAG